jgi:antitoxin (DNA-binding transcriptional repressor) of toxin-antitoxin stability system
MSKLISRLGAADERERTGCDDHLVVLRFAVPLDRIGGDEDRELRVLEALKLEQLSLATLSPDLRRSRATATRQYTFPGNSQRYVAPHRAPCATRNPRRRPSESEFQHCQRSFWKLPLCMRIVGLKVLKNRLSEYVRIASRGETVLVTDRERVVAELRPPQGRGPLASDAVLAEAMRRGWITAPLVAQSGVPPRIPVARLGELLDELDADRGDR